MLAPSWRKRRGELVHDHLRRASAALWEWQNVLDGLVEDLSFPAGLIAQVQTWEAYGGRSVELAREFEEQMSPRRLLDWPPLSSLSLESRRWLGDLVHAIWLNRCPVREWISDVATARERVDIAAVRVKEALSLLPPQAHPEDLRSISLLFAQYCEDCRSLLKALEVFPIEVMVT